MRAVPHDCVEEFLRWAETATFKGYAVLAPAFPRSEKLLLAQPAATAGDLSDEILLLIGRFALYKKELAAFVTLRQAVATAVLKSDYVSAMESLDAALSTFGTSAWLIETRIAVTAMKEGLEAQKALSERVRKVCGRTVISTVAHYTSQRNEPSTEAARYLQRVAGVLDRAPINAATRAYYEHHLSRITPTSPEKVQGLLLMEATSSLIDSFEALVSILVHSTAEHGCHLPFEIDVQHPVFDDLDDPRLTKVRFLLGRSGARALRKRSTSVDDSVLSGRKCEIGELDANDFRSIVLAAMAVEGPRESGLGPLVQGWVTDFAEALADIEHTQRATGSFDKWSCNLFAVHTAQATAEMLRDIVGGEVPFTGRRQLVALLGSPYADPWDLAFLAGEFREKYATLLSRYYGQSLTLDFCAWLSGGTESDSLATLAQRWRHFGLAFRQLRAGDFHCVVETTEQLQDDPILHVFAVRWHCHALLRLGQFREAVRYAGQLIARSAAYQTLLPISDIVGNRAWKDLRPFASEIELSVLLDHHWRQSGRSESDSFRRYAAEDFLESFGVDRPSQLGASAELDQSTFAYFLYNVCTPEVLDLMMAFPSSRSVLEERRAVYGLLSTLDPENIGVYRDGIASITHSLMLDEGVRQLDRSRLFVNRDGVVRWAERELKEAFDRYRSLLAAGIGFDQEAFADALRKFIAKQEAIPEELLALTKGEADDLMLRIVSDVRDNFLLSPTHGLDAFLSMRVRHGTLSGMLRGPLEKYMIINQRVGGTSRYQRNVHWAQVLPDVHSTHVKAIEEAIEVFSEGFDAAIDNLRDRLQIRRKEQPLGLFDITLTNVHVLLLRSGIMPETRLEDFVRSAIEVLWLLLDRSQRSVQHYIGEDFRAAVGRLFQQLESQIHTATADSPYWQLNEAIRHALTDVQAVIDGIRNWFQRDPGKMLMYPLSHAIDVAIEVVRITYRNFEPQIQKILSTHEEVFLRSVPLLGDILFIALDNVHRRSGIQRGGSVRIQVSKRDSASIVLAVENDVAGTYDYKAGQQRLEEIRGLMQAGAFRTATVSSEGGTGLLKIKSLVDPDAMRPDAVTFDFTQSGNFRVEILLPIFEVDREDLSG